MLECMALLHRECRNQSFDLVHLRESWVYSPGCLFVSPFPVFRLDINQLSHLSGFCPAIVSLLSTQKFGILLPEGIGLS